MINNEIIKLASNTTNVGLKNKYSHKISLKNTTCGDKITLELIADKKKISSMKYETVSCIYCEASASLISRRIKNINLTDLKKDFTILKKNVTKDGVVSVNPSQLKELRNVLDLKNLEILKYIKKKYSKSELLKILGSEDRDLTNVEMLNRDYYQGRFISKTKSRKPVYNWDHDINHRSIIQK